MLDKHKAINIGAISVQYLSLAAVKLRFRNIVKMRVGGTSNLLDREWNIINLGQNAHRQKLDR